MLFLLFVVGKIFYFWKRYREENNFKKYTEITHIFGKFYCRMGKIVVYYMKYCYIFGFGTASEVIK